ncbi:MAG: carboxypeptidase regulatory-like domain-containing protein [Acidobacteria bacterium]|nr:carboxypeptidase regulatory-like domain-containing protein [Acidobacteriota bacterium]
MRLGVLCFSLSVVVTAPLAAQNVSAGLSGTVTDPADAVIPAVPIEVRHGETGFVRRTTTNDTGYLSFPELTPGAYTLRIEHKGFRKYEQTSIALNSGEQRSLGRLALQVGDTASTVTVEAEAAQVQLGSSEKSGSITQEDLQNLALRGRGGLAAGRG